MADHWQLVYTVLAVALSLLRAASLIQDTRKLKRLQLKDKGDRAAQEANIRQSKCLHARRVGSVWGIVVLCIATTVAIYLYRSQQQVSTIGLSIIPGCAHLCEVCIDVRLPLSACSMLTH